LKKVSPFFNFYGRPNSSETIDRPTTMATKKSVGLTMFESVLTRYRSVEKRIDTVLEPFRKAAGFIGRLLDEMGRVTGALISVIFGLALIVGVIALVIAFPLPAIALLLLIIVLGS
jgi:hypothetical protein